MHNHVVRTLLRNNGYDSKKWWESIAEKKPRGTGVRYQFVKIKDLRFC
jgi:hypothetical protein